MSEREISHKIFDVLTLRDTVYMHKYVVISAAEAR